MFNFIMKSIKCLLIIFIFGMVAIVSIQVFSRYVLKDPATWTTEAAVITLIYFTFFGAAYSINEGQSLKINIVLDIMSPKIAASTEIFTNALSIVFFGVVVIYSYPVFTNLFSQLTPALQIPKSYLFIPIPVASVVIIWILIRQTLTLIDRIKPNNKFFNDDNTSQAR